MKHEEIELDSPLLPEEGDNQGLSITWTELRMSHTARAQAYSLRAQVPYAQMETDRMNQGTEGKTQGGVWWWKGFHQGYLT